MGVGRHGAGKKSLSLGGTASHQESRLPNSSFVMAEILVLTASTKPDSVPHGFLFKAVRYGLRKGLVM
jgi:hypothetical protein